MNKYSLTHLSDLALVAGTRSLVAQDRVTTSELIAHLAEVDVRGLYLPEGYPSIFEWCTGRLGLSEDAAFARIRAGRVAREHPAVFPMVADGRLTLTAVVLLAPVLTRANAAELLTAAAGLSKLDLKRLIAERFPTSDVFAMVAAPGAATAAPVAGHTHVEGLAAGSARESGEQLGPDPVHVPVTPAPDNAMRDRARVEPIAAGRYALQVTIDQPTFEALQYAVSLLGHSVPSGDLAQVLGRALGALVGQLEKARFGKCSRSRTSVRRAHSDPRHIPAAVRRLVWERDAGRCTFTSDHGHRCESRTRLEFDHIEPVARGGESTPSNLRLRCRAHNQHTAERAFGRDFMAHQRDEAKRRAVEAREARRAAEASAREAEARARAAEARTREVAQAVERERLDALQARRDELVPFLRHLGYSLPTARLASAVCDTMPDATLEDRLRAALRSLMPTSVRIERPTSADAA